MTKLIRSLKISHIQILLVALLLVILASAQARPAFAAGVVRIDGQPDAYGQSEITLTGSGFQSVQNGFGGVYVLFGWVNDPNSMGWAPSNGGITGETYRYVYDDETNPAGYQLFVAFPGSSTEGAANGGTIAADGTWSAKMKIPGAIFTTYDRNLNETQVDCTKVTCGVITIGAHGVKNANNESFTPVNWANLAPAQAPEAADNQTNAEGSENGVNLPADSQTLTPASQVTGAPISQPVTSVISQSADEPISGWWVVAAVVGAMTGLAVMLLAAGIGGYLAMKALILGVNPEALEKVRGKRERQAIKQRDRQRAKTKKLAQRTQLAAARKANRENARLARANMPLDTPATKARTTVADDKQLLNFFRQEQANQLDQTLVLNQPASDQESQS